MTTDETSAGSGFDELVSRYEKWRRISSGVGRTVPDEPAWDGRRLCLRYGYPHEGWTGYVIEPHNTGYNVLSVTTERRIDPAEYLDAYFSRLEDAGKYVIWNNGESVRMHVGLRPITRMWREEGLDPRVEKVPVSEGIARYQLKADPDVYLDAFSGGIKPENRLLPITYDELDAVLMEGLPQSVTS